MWKRITAIGLLLVTMNVGGWITYPKQDVFILGNDIDRSGEDYSGLYERLATATRGEQIYIILHDNGGGLAATGYAIHDAIRASKATVTTESRRETSSAALTVLFAGHYVSIPKHSSGPYVAHMSFIGDMYHPVRLWFMIQSDRAKMVFYKAFLSTDEYRRVMRGENVWLTGEGMCRAAPKKIVDDAKHCVIDNREESQ